MMRVVADLHIHTALSPCAARVMSPGAIMREAARRGLDMVAICDHNSSGNVGASIHAAGGVISVIPGIEVTTTEEVHVLGLFPTLSAAETVSSSIRDRLPERGGGPGDEQVLFGDDDEPASTETRLLLASSGLDLAAAVDLIHACGGLAVAAHVDRPSFGVLGQLGFMPEGVRFDAVEISAAALRAGRETEVRRLGLPVISGSDSHSPEEIAASVTVLEVEGPSYAELALALCGRDGRRCCCA